MKVPEPSYRHDASLSTALSNKLSYCAFYGVSIINIQQSDRYLSPISTNHHVRVYNLPVSIKVTRYAAIGRWIKTGSRLVGCSFSCDHSARSDSTRLNSVVEILNMFRTSRLTPIDKNWPIFFLVSVFWSCKSDHSASGAVITLTIRSDPIRLNWPVGLSLIGSGRIGSDRAL